MIGEVTWLSTEGVKFFRDRNFSDEAVLKFPETKEEREALVKICSSYFDVGTIKTIWREVLIIIMEYITLDGRFTRVYGYHFSLLNHFHHRVRDSFPHYLFYSLNHSIKMH